MTTFLILYILLQVSKAAILDLEPTCLFTLKSQPSKNIGVDNTIYLGSSVLH